mgnify:CR=1 FL=1
MLGCDAREGAFASFRATANAIALPCCEDFAGGTGAFLATFLDATLAEDVDVAAVLALDVGAMLADVAPVAAAASDRIVNARCAACELHPSSIYHDSSPNHHHHHRADAAAQGEGESMKALTAQLHAAREANGELTRRADAAAQGESEAVKALTAQLNAAREAHASVSQRLKTTANDAETVRAQCDDRIASLEAELRKTETLCRAQLDALARENAASLRAVHQQLQTALQSNADLKGRAEAAQHGEAESVRTLQSQLSRSQATIQEMSSALSQMQSDLESGLREREGLRVRISLHDESSKSLSSTNAELTAELNRVRETVLPVHRQLLEALAAIPDATPPPPGARTSDLAQCVSRELVRLYQALTDSHRVQQQWAATYEQAKAVNTTSSQQLRDLWKQLGEAKEEVSLREAAATRASTERDDAVRQMHECQASNNALSVELHRTKAMLLSCDARIGEMRQALEAAEATANATRMECSRVQDALQQKDVECDELRRSHDNLQHVLEVFQAQRAKETDERTAFLSYELDAAKEELQTNLKVSLERRDEIERLTATHKRELNAKAQFITGLQQKMADLRRALEETMSRMSDENMIDKRVVSHLLVNYVHSVAEKRADESDVVRVMAGLLNWDRDMMEKAGLVPGPNNPKRPGAGAGAGAAAAAVGKGLSAAGGLVSRFMWRGGPSASAAPPSDTSSVGTSSSNSAAAPSATGKAAGPSIAQLWVEFLIKEGESAGQPQHEVQAPVSKSEGAPVSAAAAVGEPPVLAS